jgi:hypothetical protein
MKQITSDDKEKVSSVDHEQKTSLVYNKEKLIS